MRWAWESHIFFSFLCVLYVNRVFGERWMKMSEMLFTFTRSPQLQYVPAARVRLCGCVCVMTPNQRCHSRFVFFTLFYAGFSGRSECVVCYAISHFRFAFALRVFLWRFCNFNFKHSVAVHIGFGHPPSQPVTLTYMTITIHSALRVSVCVLNENWQTWRRLHLLSDVWIAERSVDSLFKWTWALILALMHSITSWLVLYSVNTRTHIHTHRSLFAQWNRRNWMCRMNDDFSIYSYVKLEM